MGGARGATGERDDRSSHPCRCPRPIVAATMAEIQRPASPRLDRRAARRCRASQPRDLGSHAGAVRGATDDSMAIFRAGCRERLADWEVHAHSRANARPSTGNARLEPIRTNIVICPRGQNRRTASMQRRRPLRRSPLPRRSLGTAPARITNRMAGDLERGAQPCGLALPGGRPQRPPRCSPHRQALARRLRLRPRSPAGAVPSLSRPDGCPTSGGRPIVTPLGAGHFAFNIAHGAAKYRGPASPRHV
jgi:hypothetical protein